MGKVVTIEFDSEESAEAYKTTIEETLFMVGRAGVGFLGVRKVELDYHTPHELYEHRYELWRALCFTGTYRLKAWRSRLHQDGTMFKDSFIVGINLVRSHSAFSTRRNDITYHLPLSWWDKFEGITTYDKAPEYDGATPEEGLKRLAEYTDWSMGPTTR